MPHVETPWIGLAAIVGMFLIPHLPAWLFEGPRSVKRYPRRQVCGDCGAPWTDDHACVPPCSAADRPLQAELFRARPDHALAPASADADLRC